MITVIKGLVFDFVLFNVDIFSMAYRTIAYPTLRDTRILSAIVVYTDNTFRDITEKVTLEDINTMTLLEIDTQTKHIGEWVWYFWKTPQRLVYMDNSLIEHTI
jgi:hypothetical protein